MNKVHRVIWNASIGGWLAVAEIARSSSKKATTTRGHKHAVAAVGSLLLLPTALLASELPSGGNVVGGSGAIEQSGDTLTITQNGQRMAVDWDSFSIGKNSTVEFVQPGSNAAALNRVIGASPSKIQGVLNANGQVFLVNPNGITFTQDAQVDVGGLVASTLDIDTDDFLNGDYTFEGDSTNAIINQGNIRAGEYVAMIAARIENTGGIYAEAGTVAMGAGRKVTLDMGGPVKIEVEESALDAHIHNGGVIKADGGMVYLTAEAAGDLASTVINNDGIIEAQTLETGASGEIYLMGGMDNDQIQVGGTLDASAPNGGDGGFVETSAAKVDIQSELQVSTKAESGQTGEWLIDPTDIEIVDGDGGDFTDQTSSDSKIGVDTLTSNLANNNITVQTPDDGGTDEGNITVSTDVVWDADTQLTLDAINNIFVNAKIENTHTTDGGVFFKATNNTDAVAFDENGKVVIHNVNQLQGMNTALGGTYELGSDIDASDTVNWNGGAGWEPLGTTSDSFSGSLDGRGHTVSAITIKSSRPSGIGIFGYTDDASINNLNSKSFLFHVGAEVENKVYEYNHETREREVIDTYTTHEASEVGGLVGISRNTEINNVHVQGEINGGDNTLDRAELIGGILGKDATTTPISHSSADVDINIGTDNIGGLVGMSRSAITDSHASGDLTTSASIVGGLVANMQSGGSIKRASASGNVIGKGRYIGGLLGESFSRGLVIEQAFATGNVTAENGAGKVDVGGLVGYMYRGNIANAYSTGEVAVTTDTFDEVNLGGLVGQGNDGMTLENTYTTSEIGNNAQSATVYSGGLVGGTNEAVATASYWNTDTGLNDAGAVTGDFSGKSLNELYKESTFQDWDDSIWSFSGGRGAEVEGYEVKEALPYLTGVTRREDIVGGETFTLFASGWGDANGEGAYTIQDWNQLQNINQLLGEGFDYELASDLGSETAGYAEQVKDGDTLANEDKGWEPIGSSWEEAFIGSLDGKENIISGLTINRPEAENVGFFGYADSTTINDIGLVDIAISGGENTGGLIGWNEGASEVSSSYSTGTITGNGVAGGLIAYNNGGDIKQSYSTAEVTSSDGYGVGGLLGYHVGGHVENSYSLGDVEGDDAVGGLIGELNGTVNYSYSTGNVTASTDSNSGGFVGLAYGSTVTQSFWDTENSGFDEGVTTSQTDLEIIGKSTADLYDETTFSGWNGSGENTWTFSGGRGAEVEGYEVGDGLPYLTGVTRSKDIVVENAGTLFAGGWGDTDGDGAYTIEDWNQLQNINEVLGEGFDYELASDLGSDTAGYAEQVKDGEALANEGKGWQPIGEALSMSTSPFTGTFDGQDNTISNLVIDRSDNRNVGLFGDTSNATLENLTLKDVDISANQTNSYYGTGALIGYSTPNDHIENIRVEGGQVDGKDNVGGLIGRIDQALSTIKNSHTDVEVTGGDRVGGLVGYLNNSRIVQSSAYGSVSSTGQNIGGLVGTSAQQSEIAESYATGSVAGSQYIGGLVGTNNGSKISNTYATGSVKGEGQVGGLVGRNQNQAEILYSYAMGSVAGGQDVGGLVGADDDKRVVESYWDIETTGQQTSAAGEGKSTAGLQSLGTFANWDISTDSGDGTVWRLYEDAASPLLRAFFKSEAEITLSDASGRSYDGTTDVRLGTDVNLSAADGIDQNLITIGDVTLELESANAGENSIVDIRGISSPQRGYDLDIQGPERLTIAPRELTLGGEFSAEAKNYDGTTDATLEETTNLNLGNLVAGENLALSGLAAAFTEANAGENITVGLTEAALADGTNGQASNYVLTTKGWPTSEAIISPRPITVTANNQDKIYGNTDPELSWQLTDGNLVGDDALNGTLTRADGEDAGAYTIDAQALENGNYAITAQDGVLTIDPRPITVAADDQQKQEGQADPDLTWQITDGHLVNDESLDGTLAREQGESADTYPIQQGSVDNENNANYDIRFLEGELLITAAPEPTSESELQQSAARNAQQSASQPVSPPQAPVTGMVPQPPQSGEPSANVRIGGLRVVNVSSSEEAATSTEGTGNAPELPGQSPSSSAQPGTQTVTVVDGGIRFTDDGLGTAEDGSP